MSPIEKNCLVRGRTLTSKNVGSFQKHWAPPSLMGGKHSKDLAISRSRTTGSRSMLIGIAEGLTSLPALWPLRYRVGSRFLRSAEQTLQRAPVSRALFSFSSSLPRFRLVNHRGLDHASAGC